MHPTASHTFSSEKVFSFLRLYIMLVVILCYAIEYEIGITTPSGMPLIIYLSSYCITEIKNNYKRMF